MLCDRRIKTMRVSIKNFRTYLTREDNQPFIFDFQPGVNLLKGASGIGKTTVFHAIFWCLYKKPATGNSPLYGLKGDQTEVTIEFANDIIITRVSPKTLFTVNILSTNQILENEEAQVYIDNRFGKDYIWKTCNYISQGNINQLLSSEISESQKWEVLYNVSLGNQNSHQITIDGLKQKLKLKTTDLETQFEKYTREIEYLDSTLKSLKDKQGSLEMENMEVYPVEPLYLKMKNKTRFPNRSSLEGILDNLISKLETIESARRERVDKLKSQNTDYEREALKLKDFKQKLVDSQTQITRLKRKLRDWEMYEHSVNVLLKTWDFLTQVPRDKLKEKAVKFSRELTKFKTLPQLPPTDTDEEFPGLVEEYLVYEHLTRELADKTKTFFQLNPKLDPLKTDLDNLAVTTEEEETRHLVNCPSCDHTLSVIVFKNLNVKVGVPEGEVVKLSSRSRELLNQIRNIKSQTRNSKTFPETCTRYRSMDIKLLKEWYSIPGTLRTLVRKYHSEGDTTDVNFLEREPEKIEDGVHLQLKDLEMDSLRLDSEIHETQTRLVNLEGTIKMLEREVGKLNFETKELETQISQLRDEEAWWREVDSKFTTKEEIEQEYLRFKKSQSTAKELDELKSRLRDLEHKRDVTTTEKITPLHESLLAITDLKKIIEETESQYLSECVNHVTSVTNGFLENSFDKPLSLNLITEKDLKTTGKKKHSLAVKIYTTSNDDTQSKILERDLDGFSGGETDRISLGVSLGISSLSPFPFVLLDECISSLDTEMKDKVIRALRQQAKITNKSIILVCHDALEGLFDHVVEL